MRLGTPLTGAVAAALLLALLTPNPATAVVRAIAPVSAPLSPTKAPVRAEPVAVPAIEAPVGPPQDHEAPAAETEPAVETAPLEVRPIEGREIRGPSSEAPPTELPSPAAPGADVPTLESPSPDPEVETGAARHFGRIIGTVEIEGAGNAATSLPQLPLSRGSRLSRHSLQQSIRLLYRSDRFAKVSAVVRDASPDDSSGPVRLIFRVEPIRRVTRVGFVGLRALDESTLQKAVDLPPGTEFSEARITRAAQQVATAAFRAGYRHAFVRWDATPAGDDVSIDFSLSEGDPTVLKKLLFVGDPGLLPAELKVLIPLVPGAPLSLPVLESGIQELRNTLRRRGFLRAQVHAPRVTVRDREAVVELPVEAGPHISLHVRGNRTFTESLLLSQLRYAGEEILDPGMQRELAERLRAFYELAGHPEARVLVRESGPPPPGRTPLDPLPPELVPRDTRLRPASSLHDPHPIDLDDRVHAARSKRTVTFVVSEGPRMHVVERVFEGVQAFEDSELNRRIDLVLEDSMPEVLRGGRDEALLRASFVSGSPAPTSTSRGPEERPRVRPREVFAEAPYRAASSEIADLYRSKGYLDAVVGPARLEPIEGDLARVVVPVVEGPRTLVTRIEFRSDQTLAEGPLRQGLRIRECDPLSFYAVEESRTAALQQLLARGHFYAQVEAADEPAPEDDERCGTSNGEELSRSVVVFHVKPGPVVRVGRIEIRGAVKTKESLVAESLALDPGDPITPWARQQSVRNLMRLGLFNSASVDPADPDLVEAEKTLVVEVREKPTMSAELRFGGSLADGPRISGHLLRSYLGGQNRSFTANAKLNWPLFRLLMEEQNCLRDLNASSGVANPACRLPDDPIERRLNLGLLLPQLQAGGGPVVEVRTEAVHENLLRPSYQLSRFALLGAVDGLVRTRVGIYDVSTLLEAELEHATYGSRQFSTGLPETMADLLARRMPEGTVLLASLRPTLTVDGRDDKFNPTRGVVASLSLDLSRSLFAREPTENDSRPFDVALIRALMSARGYVPLRDDGRVVLAFAGNFGTVLKQPESRVIGTKRFFLGGTASIRGFNEDALVPEDERAQLHEARELCSSGAVLPDGALPCDAPVLQSLANGNHRSEGGEVMASGRAELRLALGGSLGAGFFVDAGNLWLDPSAVNLLHLRYAAGAGLRFALPIGPAAFDVGVNLNPDLVFYEPRFRVHLSVGLF